MHVTVNHLQSTGIGRTVNSLRKDDGEVGAAAKTLITKWKEMVANEASDGSEEDQNREYQEEDEDSSKTQDELISETKSYRNHEQFTKSSGNHQHYDYHNHQQQHHQPRDHHSAKSMDSHSHQRKVHTALYCAVQFEILQPIFLLNPHFNR